jgi:hypothetical protein
MHPACRDHGLGSDYAAKEQTMTSQLPMKYMLIMNTPERGPYEILTTWSKQDLEAHMAFMRRFNQKLSQAGELVGGAGLTGPDQAKLVRAGASAEPITDGVFPETKEFLAGYWLVDVDSPERAYALAAEASMAPGPGGAPLRMPIEVRQVMFEIDPAKHG